MKHAPGILLSKGGINMNMKGWALTMGIGAAVGAVAVMTLPKQSTARKLVNKAANTVEDAVQNVTDKITDTWDM